MTKKILAVSVIVPLYNVEKYIGECLTSLANQTLKNFEVIVVDDCSTDNSLGIVQSFSEIFGNRLRIAKLSSNSGCPGIPRNFALEAASGEYVYFLDSDDFLSETALEELYAVAKNFDADVVHSDWYIAFENVNGKFEFKQRSFQAGNFVTEPTLETFDIGERVTGFVQKKFLWWACNKLFRRKFLTENKIKFPETDVFEDFVFAFECLVAAKNYVRVPFASYCYRLREDSLSHKAVTGEKLVNHIIDVIKSTDDFMNGRKFFVDNPQYKYMLVDFFMQERLDVFSKVFIIKGEYTIGEIYNFLCKDIFSRRPQDIASLTAYLFIACSKLKLEVEN